MVKLRLTSFVFFIAVYMSNIKESNTVPVSSNPTTEVERNNQNSSGFNIHLMVESSITSSNLKNIIRNEIIVNDLDKDMNCSTAESSDRQFDIEPRFKPEEENLATKLETIEKVLKDIQAENKKLSASIEQRNIDLIWEKSVGVRCSSCIKTVKSRTEYPQNCKEVQRNGNNVTGIYEIYPKHSKRPFPVLCDMDIREGGWTHIQKRFDGSLDFNREWRDYKFGFGELEGEFWLGLENIHLLTGLESVELLVEVVDRDGKSVYAHYNSFSIGPETGSYKLERLSGFSGDAGDSLTHHLGQKFSTKDIDWTERGCATRHRGGWWFFNCLWSNLNGKYTNIDLPLSKFYYIGLYWYTYKDENCLTGSRMLVRPKN